MCRRNVQSVGKLRLSFRGLVFRFQSPGAIAPSRTPIVVSGSVIISWRPIIPIIAWGTPIVDRPAAVSRFAMEARRWTVLTHMSYPTDLKTRCNRIATLRVPLDRAPTVVAPGDSNRTATGYDRDDRILDSRPLAQIES